MMLGSFNGQFARRNRCLFAFGCRSGFRISELLSLRVGDVMDRGRVRARVTIAAEFMKGRENARTVYVRPDVKSAIRALVAELRYEGFTSDQTFLFKSRARGNHAISRWEAWDLFRRAFRWLGIRGKLGTHFMRKTFAGRAYRHSRGNLLKVQAALGHKRLDSTAAYLQTCLQADIDRLIRKI